MLVPMFVVEKLLSRLLFPLPLGLIVAIVGVILLARSRVAGRRLGLGAEGVRRGKRMWNAGFVLVGGALALLWAASTAPLADAFLWTLEGRYRQLPAVPEDAELIHVLGGGHAEREGLGPWSSLGASSRARVVEGFRLAARSESDSQGTGEAGAPPAGHGAATSEHGADGEGAGADAAGTGEDGPTGGGPGEEGPDGGEGGSAIASGAATDGGALPVVFSGYAGAGQVSSAEMGREAAVELGLDRARTRVFTEPRNTREEADAAADAFPGATVVLVTSASHMRRSVYFFERAGLDVIPAPADFLAASRHYSAWHLFPSADALRRTRRAWYEYLGLVRARLGG